MRRAYQGSDAGGEAGQAALADGLGTRLGPAATFATTEHFNLQTARAVTVSEANGRASIYLAALSGNLITLAFVGQMSRLGATFYAFALILLPVLAFVGVVTFVRLVQSSIEDLAYAHRIALLRSFYLRVSPELEPYLVVARPRSAPAHGETARTRRMATDAHGRRDGRGRQQRRGGGVRRPGAGSCGRPLAGDSGCRRSSHRSWCLHVAGTPPPPRARLLQPGGCRSGRDPDFASATGRRGLKDESPCRRSHVVSGAVAR